MTQLCNGRCDRVLWYGKGVKQISYFRSESKFSDHRPVSALFSTQIEADKRANCRLVVPALVPSGTPCSIVSTTMILLTTLRIHVCTRRISTYKRLKLKFRYNVTFTMAGEASKRRSYNNIDILD